ncbi:MAG: ATP-binding protein [Melioribacteraceae bacterium]|nr:ATP-binding protein [Melioribacteraceae bacterium]
MNKKENPFYFGNEVYDSDFCNRTEELNELQKDINSGINVLLYAPRRFGKTSLLKKLQTKLEGDKNYTFIYFDFF